MKKRRLAVLLVRLEPPHSDYLRKRAARQGKRSVASVIRELVTEAMAAEQSRPQAS